jgi:hypothetical protein
VYGLPACLIPKPLSQSMRAGARDTEGAIHAPGGITQSTITLLPTPAAPAVLSGDVPRRRTCHRLRQPITWWRRLPPWPIRRRTMGGPSWPRLCLQKSVRIPRFSRPIRGRTRPWNLAFAGSRAQRRSALCRPRNPNGLRPWRWSRWSDYRCLP